MVTATALFDEANCGGFWHFEDNPLEPWGYFDKDETINIPFPIETVLGDATYASHELVFDDGGLEEVGTSVNDNGVITPQVRKATAATLDDGSKYGVTLRLSTTDGQTIDVTGYLKVRRK